MPKGQGGRAKRRPLWRCYSHAYSGGTRSDYTSAGHADYRLAYHDYAYTWAPRTHLGGNASIALLIAYDSTHSGAAASVVAVQHASVALRRRGGGSPVDVLARGCGLRWPNLLWHTRASV